MILGMSLPTFTTLHVVISLIGIATGVLCLFALLSSRVPSGLTATFLLALVVVLAIIVGLTVLALKRFRPALT